MKRFFTILMLSLMLLGLAACGGQEAVSSSPEGTVSVPPTEATSLPPESVSPVETESPPAESVLPVETESPPPESLPPVETASPTPEKTTVQRDLFDAVMRQDVLAVVLYGPTAAELERLSALGFSPVILDDSDGVYFDEVLIVPRYGDCTISLDYVEWDEAAGDYVVTGNMGGMAGSGEADAVIGGLFVRSMLPEGEPTILVTVTRGDESGQYLLGYDGRGGSSWYILSDFIEE